MEQQQQQQEDEILQSFCSLTSCSPQQARMFLESCSWQLEPALQVFFDMDSAEVESPHNNVREEDDVRRPPEPAHVFPSSVKVSEAEAEAVAVPVAGPDSSRSKRTKDKQPAGGVKTLEDLNRHSDSDSDGPQEYYTGGEKSGMLVQDPSKGHRDVNAIFDQARRMGAQEGPVEPPQAPSSSRRAFSGISRTLGESREQLAEGVGQPAQQQPVTRNIVFWRDGFTVDDGPLRRLDDPANAQFLMSIYKSECPKELQPADGNTSVHVNLIRKDAEWQPPQEPKHVPFRGVGRTLGSSASSDVPSPQAVSSQPFQGLEVDSSKPVTSIQLRLLDGTRLVARFNHHHTIADIRGFIDAARPGNVRTYQLQTMGFPPKVLGNSSETLEQAGLINAVVIQKA